MGVDELLTEAKQWEKRCHDALTSISDKGKGQLLEGIAELAKAISLEAEAALENAIDFVTDVFIELEI